MPRTVRASGGPGGGYYGEDPAMAFYGSAPQMSSMGYVDAASIPTAPPSAPVSLRASSGAWTPAEDQTLMQARASSLHWAAIQAQYFPNKTANACRKRHERLMDRRNADDWEQTALENLSKEYMSMRREIWTPLATRTGQKWTTVETKCMSSGLKNLQSAARAGARRERLERLEPASYDDPATDDSAIGLDELEGDGAGVGAAGRLTPNSGGAYGAAYGAGPGARGYGNMMPRDGDGYGAVQLGRARSDYVGLHQRVPSIDMGIGAIINRPPAAP